MDHPAEQEIDEIIKEYVGPPPWLEQFLDGYWVICSYKPTMNELYQRSGKAL